MQPFRIEPRMPVENVQTYSIVAPVATHFRRATCAEVDCVRFLDGFAVMADESTAIGQARAHYIRHDRSRAHTEEHGAVTAFLFPPGTRCFEEHQTRLDRPELYLVRGGDWRGNPRQEQRRHMRPELWVEDFGEHQQRLADRLKEGEY